MDSAALLLILVVVTMVIDSDRSLPVDTFDSAQTFILYFNYFQLQANQSVAYWLVYFT